MVAHTGTQFLHSLACMLTISDKDYTTCFLCKPKLELFFNCFCFEFVKDVQILLSTTSWDMISVMDKHALHTVIITIHKEKLIELKFYN